MIGWLSGVVKDVNAHELLLDVNGTGYEIEMPTHAIESLPAIGQAVEVFTHLAVREDAHSLYGFTSKDDKQLFRTLIKINGVGAKMALSILSTMPAGQLVQCIDRQDVDALVKVPGVGKKTAQRLLIELKDKTIDLSFDRVSLPTGGATPLVAVNGPDQVIYDAKQALSALGYKPAQVDSMIKAVANENDSTEALIKKALQSAVKMGGKT